jgi:hypothetical protein
MAGFLPSLLRLRAMASLLLAVIALQATPAKPLPLAPDRGPAFSAASIEVAVVARRVQLAEVRPEARPDPLPPPIPREYRAALAISSAPLELPQTPAETPGQLSLDVRPATPPRAPPAA